MALDTNILRTILMYLGIKDLVIKFNPANSCIVVDYDHYNVHCTKNLTFQEIEQLFSVRSKATG